MDWPLIISTIIYLAGWVICVLGLAVIPRRRDPGAAQAWGSYSFSSSHGWACSCFS
jgi:hypothetical protein